MCFWNINISRKLSIFLFNSAMNIYPFFFTVCYGRLNKRLKILPRKKCTSQNPNPYKFCHIYDYTLKVTRHFFFILLLQTASDRGLLLRCLPDLHQGRRTLWCVKTSGRLSHSHAVVGSLFCLIHHTLQSSKQPNN